MQDRRRSCQYLKTIVISSVKPTIISWLKYCLPATKSIFYLNSPLLYQMSHSLTRLSPNFSWIAFLLGRIREKNKYDKSLVSTPGCAYAMLWKLEDSRKRLRREGPCLGSCDLRSTLCVPGEETIAHQLKPNNHV